MARSAPVQVSSVVEAGPEAVYDLVADLPRMGEWSPECRAVRWKAGASRAEAGARFGGRNRHGVHRWRTRGVVEVADRGRTVAWRTSFLGLPMSRWTYEFADLGGGRCQVTERWEDRQIALTRPWVVGWLVTGVRARADRNRETMLATLDRLKTAAENGASLLASD